MRPLLPFALSLALAILTLGGCDTLTGNIENLTVVFVNESGSAIHILAENETFDASNRLNPGQSRTTVFPTSSSELGSSFMVMGAFRAGINGMTTTTTNCSGTFDPDYVGPPVVAYTGGALDCRNWFN